MFLIKTLLCEKNINKIVRPVLATLSANGLTQSYSELLGKVSSATLILLKITLE